ncbi:MAG: flagellar export chaperone FliS [Planctomycetota bacterium]
MNPSSSQYNTSRILTASQPALQMMLLDGALRNGRQALNSWAEDNWSEVDALLDKTMQILEELIQAVAGGQSELSAQFEEQYVFAYRSLTSCRINRDKDQLLRTLDLLSYQRQTWKLACERLQAEAPAESTQAEDEPAGPKPTAAPHFSTDVMPSAGLSIEA